MTRKDYELLADALKSLADQRQIENAEQSRAYLLGYLGAALKADNPKFNLEKFRKASGV